MSALRQMSDHVVDLFQAAQSVLDNMRDDRDELRGRVEELDAKLHTLEAEALDTQRNEERAAAEINEVAMKLNTLEAAVRAVREAGALEVRRDRELSNLYALVPDGSEGGGV